MPVLNKFVSKCNRLNSRYKLIMSYTYLVRVQIIISKSIEIFVLFSSISIVDSRKFHCFRNNQLGCHVDYVIVLVNRLRYYCKCVKIYFQMRGNRLKLLVILCTYTIYIRSDYASWIVSLWMQFSKRITPQIQVLKP